MTFNQYYVRTWPRTFRHMLRRLGNYDDAEDAAQIAYLKMFRSLGSFRRSSALDSWFYRIAENTAKDVMRKRVRLKETSWKSLTYLTDIRSSYAAASPGFENGLVEEERRLILYDAIDELQPSHRELLLLRFNGLKHREVAQRTGANIRTAKSRLHRAEELLAERVREKLEAPLKKTA